MWVASHTHTHDTDTAVSTGPILTFSRNFVQYSVFDKIISKKQPPQCVVRYAILMAIILFYFIRPKNTNLSYCYIVIKISAVSRLSGAY